MNFSSIYLNKNIFVNLTCYLIVNFPIGFIFELNIRECVYNAHYPTFGVLNSLYFKIYYLVFVIEQQMKYKAKKSNSSL